MCNPLAPARDQCQSAWHDGYASAKQEWVGLTDDELLESYGWMVATIAPDWILEGAKEELLGALRKVENAIKEKNT